MGMLYLFVSPVWALKLVCYKDAKLVSSLSLWLPLVGNLCPEKGTPPSYSAALLNATQELNSTKEVLLSAAQTLESAADELRSTKGELLAAAATTESSLIEQATMKLQAIGGSLGRESRILA